MRSSWLFFRAVCALQILIIGFFTLGTTGRLFFDPPGFINLLLVVASAFELWLPLFALQLFSRNYPDIPVEGRQKAVFNWLFLINFLLIAVFFGNVFNAINSIRWLTSESRRFPIPFIVIFFFVLQILALIFHVLILGGLFSLRRLLRANSETKSFDFEKHQPY